MPDVIVLTGPCGVGKTSVAFECMELLEGAGVAAAMVDGELAYFTPKPAGDPFGYAVAQAALAALWPVYAAAGLDRLLLARVVEDEEQLAIVTNAVPGARVRLLRLVAGVETIRARLAQREIGSALEWHVARGAQRRDRALDPRRGGGRGAHGRRDRSRRPAARGLAGLGRRSLLRRFARAGAAAMLRDSGGAVAPGTRREAWK